MSNFKLQELAPYLPYGVNVSDGRSPFELTEHNFTNVFPYITKIHLRPLSELEDYFKELWNKKDKETLEFLDSDFLHSFEYLEVETLHNTRVNYLPVGLYNLLLKHHFDLFDFFDRGLAEKLDDIRLVKSI